MSNPFGAPKTSGGTATAAKKTPAKAAAKTNGKPPAATEAEDAPEPDEAPVTLSKAGPRKDPFALGGGGGGGDYSMKDFLGELLLVNPTDVGEQVTKASNGKIQQYTLCDFYRLENPDEDGNPEFVEDMKVFQTVLNKKFRKVFNGPNNWALGRLEMGEAAVGKNAPYLFSAPTEEEIDATHKWALAQGLDL